MVMIPADSSFAASWLVAKIKEHNERCIRTFSVRTLERTTTNNFSHGRTNRFRRMLMRDDKRKTRKTFLLGRTDARKQTLRTIERTETFVCSEGQTHVGLALIGVHDKR